MEVDNSSSSAADVPKLAKPSNENVFFRVRLTSEVPTKDLETPALFKNFVLSSLKALYGVVGSSLSFDILSWDTKQQEAIIRTTKEASTILWSTLTLTSAYGGRPCRFEMIQASASLAAVAYSSRQELSLTSIQQMAIRSHEGSMTL